ncbi:DUF4835 family protein [Porphyromonas cangingivalis]|uniref:DUF4835 domain-containing protein n=1 Tax=Porphyromonas cangingivalis TaxID=36874 RepID=A0A1T4M1Y9_PORCN|nr:DUF4835 family protein [Porphyromonas cangingivalis]SJZ60941.1 protein of unknown function [Porphyromonas cangingivalis]VEJ03824.1 Uncharacterised protein [Porphyromonas cangingivalis]
MISWGDKRIGCRVLLLVLFLCWQQGECLAQFFSPRVRVSSSTVDEQSSRYFDKIEQRLTDLVFAFAPEVSCAAPKLPIDCELSLLISAVSGDRYTGDLRVRILRPVYGQQARSIVMQVGERGLTFDFSPYEPSLGQRVGVPEDAFFRRIYYYLLVGSWLYYDSFGDEGGTPFVSYLSAHTSDFYDFGTSNEIADRGIVPEVLLPRLREKSVALFREGYYIYHRLGLDRQYKSSEAFSDALSSTLDLFEEIKSEEPAHPLLTLFADTKLSEIHSLLDSKPSPQNRALTLRLSELFPSHQLTNR